MGLVKPGNKVTSLIFSPLIYMYIYFSSWFPRPHSRCSMFSRGTTHCNLVMVLLFQLCSDSVSFALDVQLISRLFPQREGWLLIWWVMVRIPNCAFYGTEILPAKTYHFLMIRFNEPFKNWDTRLWLVKLEPIILEQCLQSSFAPIKMAAH